MQNIKLLFQTVITHELANKVKNGLVSQSQSLSNLPLQASYFTNQKENSKFSIRKKRKSRKVGKVEKRVVINFD